MTRSSGRGVETQLTTLGGVLEVLAAMPEAASLAPAAAEVRTAMTEAEGVLQELWAVDEQIEARRARAEELVERAYQAYYATRNELLKIYNNDRRLVDTFFLD